MLDTSGLLAWIDADQRLHSEVVASMQEVEPPYVVSPFVLAELDYLLATRVGQGAQHALLEEVSRGAFRLETFDAGDVAHALEVMSRLADLKIGLADASVVVLAERLGSEEILTLDERHFRVVTNSRGQPFKIRPADFQR